MLCNGKRASLSVDRKVSTTASIKQLTTPVSNEHAQYDAYRGNLVEPVQCENCVDVFVMKEPFIMSVKQVNLMVS